DVLRCTQPVQAREPESGRGDASAGRQFRTSGSSWRTNATDRERGLASSRGWIVSDDKKEATVQLRSQRFDVPGGVVLTADVGGDPDSPPVIFMHGGGQTRHSWGKAARDLVALGFRVLSLDLRGHGESSWSEQGDYAIDSFIADLKCIM